MKLLIKEKINNKPSRIIYQSISIILKFSRNLGLTRLHIAI